MGFLIHTIQWIYSISNKTTTIQWYTMNEINSGMCTVRETLPCLGSKIYISRKMRTQIIIFLWSIITATDSGTRIPLKTLISQVTLYIDKCKIYSDTLNSSSNRLWSIMLIYRIPYRSDTLNHGHQSIILIYRIPSLPYLDLLLLVSLLLFPHCARPFQQRFGQFIDRLRRPRWLLNNTWLPKCCCFFTPLLPKKGNCQSIVCLPCRSSRRQMWQMLHLLP